jgi:DNA-binding GntR family transcriptional regulator
MAKRIVRDPIYQQLNQLLRGAIRTKRFVPGDQFLTERQISEEFGVSRATANKALSNLVAEGVLEFRKGIGTFVRGGILDYDLRALVSFTSKAIAAGKRPSTTVLLLTSLKSGGSEEPQLDERLRIGPHEEVYSIERLRLIDDEPVILERRFVVSRYCPGLSEADLTGSLYALWTGRYRLEIVGADQTIRAVAISGADSRLLGVARGAAGFQVTATGYLSGGTPLWWERTLFRGDQYEFQNRVGPVQTARPATGTLVDSQSETDGEQR